MRESLRDAVLDVIADHAYEPDRYLRGSSTTGGIMTGPYLYRSCCKCGWIKNGFSWPQAADEAHPEHLADEILALLEKEDDER